MAVTITNEWPVLQTGAPAASSVSERVSVNVTTDGAATTITITHNMAVSAADLNSGMPEVTVEPLTSNFLSLALNMISGKAANLLGLTFLAVASQFRVVIKRPHTLGR